MSIIDPSVFSTARSFSTADYNWSNKMSSSLMGALISNTPQEHLPCVLEGFKEINFSKADQIFRATLKDLPSNMCIATTGSDARGEKASGRESPMEIIVITDPDEDDLEELDDEKENRNPSMKSSLPFPKEAAIAAPAPISERIRTTVSKHSDQFDRYISFKEIGGENPNYLYPEPKKPGIKVSPLVVPTRPLDAQYLFGNQEVFKKFMQKSRESMKVLNSKDLKQFKKNFCEPSLNALETCLNSASKDAAVDLNQGELKYDGKRIKSVKYSFLRPIQYKIGYEVVRALKENQISSETLTKMPVSIPERIGYLQERGLLTISKEQTDQTIRAYSRAMQWYLLSQFEFEAGNTKVFVPPAELREVGRTIQDFVKHDPLISSQNLPLKKVNVR